MMGYVWPWTMTAGELALSVLIAALIVAAVVAANRLFWPIEEPSEEPKVLI